MTQVGVLRLVGALQATAAFDILLEID